MSLLTLAFCIKAQRQTTQASEQVRPTGQFRYSMTEPPVMWIEPARRSHSDLLTGKTHLTTDPAYKYSRPVRAKK